MKRPVASLAVLLLVGCAGPTVQDSAIVSQAVRSSESMVSELRTARLVTGAQLDDKTWWRYADVMVTDAETSADTIEDTFSSRQPPSRGIEPVYRRTSLALSDAADLITDLRVAVRRHDETEIAQLREEIAKSADELEHLAESLK